MKSIGSGSSGGNYFAEAESGTLSGCNAASSLSGYSGSGYVNGSTFTGSDYVEVTVNTQTAGSYEVVIGYNGQYGDKDQRVTVNGGQQKTVRFPSTSSFIEQSAGTYSFNAGNNKIRVTASWGWMHIDYIKVSKGTKSATIEGQFDESQEVNYMLYPNPVRSQLNVKGEGNYSLELIGFGGESLWVKKDIIGHYVMGVSGLPDGIYYLRIKDEKGVRVEKIVVKK